jgi:hypothetical protein
VSVRGGTGRWTADVFEPMRLEDCVIVQGLVAKDIAHMLLMPAGSQTAFIDVRVKMLLARDPARSTVPHT